MKNYLYIFIIHSILIYATIPSVHSQSDDSYPVSDEYAYVHCNTSLAFVGEYLYYKLYVLDAKSLTSSALSKVGYVALVSEDGATVFNQKSFLLNGNGQGDFFIPVDIASGNYKLIAYTKNMLLQNTPHIFHQDISILNPYKGNQSAILGKRKNLSSQINEFHKSTERSDKIKLDIDANVYETRAPITITLETTDTTAMVPYSISVRRKSTLPHAARYPTSSLMASNSTAISVQHEGILPELRGELINGKIRVQDTSVSSETIKMALSIPGSENHLALSSVTSEGEFFFTLPDTYTNTTAIVEPVGIPKEAVETSISKNLQIDVTNLPFYQVTIVPEMEDAIRTRSIHNQIENAFYTAKPDTIKLSPSKKSILKGTSRVYNLDEYTRFKTMEETMIEIVNEAWVDTDTNGKRELMALPVYGAKRTDNSALLVVDGIYISNHELILDYDATRIEQIRFIKDLYFLGPAAFQGIFIIDTIEDDFAASYSLNANKIQLQPPSVRKQYFKQQYASKKEKANLPDYRHQLFWDSNLNLSGTKKELTIYTSDVTGTYEIVVEGFQKDGTPVSLLKQFEVIE